MNIKFPR